MYYSFHLSLFMVRTTYVNERICFLYLLLVHVYFCWFVQFQYVSFVLSYYILFKNKSKCIVLLKIQNRKKKPWIPYPKPTPALEQVRNGHLPAWSAWSKWCTKLGDQANTACWTSVPRRIMFSVIVKVVGKGIEWGKTLFFTGYLIMKKLFCSTFRINDGKIKLNVKILWI